MLRLICRGNSSPTAPNLRGPGIADYDFSLFKDLQFGKPALRYQEQQSRVCQARRHAGPSLPSLQQGGFTIEFWVRFSELSNGQTVLDTRLEGGKGISITTSNRNTLNLTLNDGVRESSWDSDPGFHPGTMKTGVWQHVAFVVDGGPKIVTVMVDGVLNDGGEVRDYGWGRLDPTLGDVNGKTQAPVAPAIFGEMKQLRIYNRYLRTSELVSNWRDGMA
jgi:hypothetical protein